MRTGLIAICALAAAGCFQQVDDPSIPATEDIAELERALARHPCVGDLDGWERNYRFSKRSGLLTPYSLNPDFNVIEFHLRRAGTVTIEPGRTVMRWTEGQDWPDTGTTQSVDGRFTVDGSTLEISRCRPVAGS
jgi:hypothetical protein